MTGDRRVAARRPAPPERSIPLFAVPKLEEGKAESRFEGREFEGDRGAEPVHMPRVEVPSELMPGLTRTTLQVVFRIDEDGSSQMEVLAGSGIPAVDLLAADTLSNWRWRPRLVGGRPVFSEVHMTVDLVPSAPRR